MHTVDLLDQAIRVARQIGYRVRYDWFEGNGGGVCEIKGQKAIFLDVAQGPADHLELVLEALRADPLALACQMTPSLRDLLGLPKAA